MKAILISFEDDGSGCPHQKTLQQHAQRMECYPELVLSMALNDGSRHGIIQVFASDEAAERYLEDEAFLALSYLPGSCDFFVRRFDVVAHTQAKPAGRTGQSIPPQAVVVQDASRQGQVKGNRPMMPHEAISEYLRDLARYYRVRHAEDNEIPDLGRASDLEHFACYVKSLSPDDPRLTTLAKLTWLECDGVVSPGPHFSSALADLSSFPTAGYDALLDHLVHAAIDDAIEQDRSMVAAFSDEIEATLR